MMFAGAALTALDFLTGLATDAAKSATQQSAASARSSAASTFALANTSSIAANQTASCAGTSSPLSADTLQTLLALQQDFKQTSSAELPSLLGGGKQGKSLPRNAVLQETQQRLQQAQMLAIATPGQSVTLTI